MKMVNNKTLPKPFDLLRSTFCLQLSTFYFLASTFYPLLSTFCLVFLPATFIQHYLHLLKAVYAMTGGAPGNRSHYRARPGGVATESGCGPGPAAHSGPAAYPGKHTSLQRQSALRDIEASFAFGNVPFTV